MIRNKSRWIYFIVSVSAISSFKSIENKYDVYVSLREQAMKIINFYKKELKLLTKEVQGPYEDAKISYICK